MVHILHLLCLACTFSCALCQGWVFGRNQYYRRPSYPTFRRPTTYTQPPQQVSSTNTGSIPQQPTVVQQYKAPVQQHQTPVQQNKAPVQHHQAPVQQYKEPVQQYKAPVQQHQAPVQQYKAPVQQHQALAQQYKAPVQQHQAPEQQYKAPAQQYKASVQQHQAPVQQYKAPVQQYQAPRVVCSLNCITHLAKYCPTNYTFALAPNSCHEYPCRCISDDNPTGVDAINKETYKEEEKEDFVLTKKILSRVEHTRKQPASAFDKAPLRCPGGNCVEGDIRYTAAQKPYIDSLYQPALQRSIFEHANFHWPKDDKDGFYYVPYVVDSSLTASIKDKIPSAMTDIATGTCIRFVERRTQSSYVKFEGGSGCSSWIGRTGSPGQEITLGRYCDQTGVIAHEIMHALGFLHEQSRPDRDQYISINETNVKEGYIDNFKMRSTSLTFGTPYDYYSVMHYGLKTFAKDRNYQTIVPLKNVDTSKIGQRTQLSNIDKKELNKLYPCDHLGSSMTTKPTISTTTITPSKNSNIKSDDKCELLKKRGKCSKPRIRNLCSFTCKGVVEECVDQRGMLRCEAHKKLGYCTISAGNKNTHIKCQKTCGLCSGQAASSHKSISQDSGSCYDLKKCKKSDCSGSGVGWCKKTCKRCG